MASTKRGPVQMVAHLLEADPNLISKDPAYPLFCEYEKRLRLLNQMCESHRVRFAAEPEVPMREAQKLGHAGEFEAQGESTIVVHTKHAMRALIGRVNAPGKEGYGIAGAWKAAAALKAIWYLSSRDNPYADWALVQILDLHRELMADLLRQSEAMLKVLQALKARGLNYSILRSREPLEVSLGFHSPYGYVIAELVAQYDDYVRLVKTLGNRAQLTDREEDARIHAMRKQVRDLFERSVRLERCLRNEKLRELSRRDWLPTADEAAKQRIAAACTLMGTVPREVFDGSKQPDFTKRGVRLSELELRLLHTLPLDMAPSQGKLDEASMDPNLGSRLV